MFVVLFRKSFTVLLICSLILAVLPVMKEAQANSAITVGKYITFGKYNNEPILWRVISKDGAGDVTLLSDRILTFKAFDSKGSYHLKDGAAPGNMRVNQGSNYYPDSNIRQWLNSSSPNSGTSTIDWIQNDPTAANMQVAINGYNTEKGFLADGNFTATERALIKPLTHKVVIAGVDGTRKDGGTANHTNNTNAISMLQNYDTTANFKNVTDQVFLLSVKQLKEWVMDQNSVLLLGPNYMLAKPTAAAVAQNALKDPNAFSTSVISTYWLSSADAATGDMVRNVLPDGVKVMSTQANSPVEGIRPALQLKLNGTTFAVAGDGSAAKPFVVTGSTADLEPPTAPSGLTSANVTQTGLTLNWTASTDAVGVKSYDVYQGTNLLTTLTGSGTTAPVTTFAVTGLTASTNYSFKVVAKDAAGNVSADSNVLNVKTAAPPDTVAPTAPTGLAASNVTQTGLTLTWTASTDAVGVTAYEVYRGATLQATVTGTGTSAPPTTYAVTGLTASTAYSFTVLAKDAAGNASASSNAINVTTLTPDTVKPSIPTGLTSTNVTKNGFTANWTASTDNVGVTGYDVFLDKFVATVSTTSYTFSNLNENTSYSVNVKARDAAGNISGFSAALIVQTLDGTAPTVPTGLTAANIGAKDFTVNWTASTDAVGVTGYEVYLGGSLVTTVTNTTHTFSGLTDNTDYSVTVKARDAAGNLSASSQALSVKTLDGTAPSAPSGIVIEKQTETGFTVRWTASTDNVGVTNYEVNRNGTKVGTVSGLSYTFSGLPLVSSHAITIRAQDAAGNFSNLSNATQVKLKDSKVPSTPTKVTITKFSPTSLAIRWTASTDNVGVTGYQVFRNGKLVNTSKTTTFSITGMTENTAQTITVLAVDAAGNKSALSTPVRTRNTLSVVGTKLYNNFKLVNLGTGQLPSVVGGQTMVPHKPVLQELGFKLSVNATTKAITASRTGLTIRFTPNSRVAVVNGQNKTMPVAATNRNGTVTIPLGFFATEVGYLTSITK